MRKLVLLLSLITCSFLTAQKVDFNDHLAQGIDAAIELRYPDLEAILAKERKLNPDNRMSDYLEAVSLVLQMFLVEDEAFLMNVFLISTRSLKSWTTYRILIPIKEFYKRS